MGHEFTVYQRIIVILKIWGPARSKQVCGGVIEQKKKSNSLWTMKKCGTIETIAVMNSLM